ncbi:MAG: V-type ATPase subunit [Candidatus Altiarchaeota archaeon]|nr:V-type ATPase subunit [Candidatus Altiarchaeota archaeon]
MNGLMQDSMVQYAYAYGRVSGMEAKLVSGSTIDSMMSARSAAEAASALDSASYAKELSGVDAVSKDALEDALAESFRRTFREISSMIPEQDSREIGLIFWRGWDVQGIKDLVRRMHVGQPASAPSSALVWSMSPAVLSELSNAAGVEELYSKLPSEYKSMLKKAFAEYSKTHSLFNFENAVDTALVSNLLSEVKGALREHVKMKVDAVNIMSAVRCRSAKISPQEYLIWDGFYLTSQKLRAISDASSGIPEVLAGTPYAELIRASEAASHDSYYSDLDGALRKFISNQVARKALEKPLSVYSVLRFIELKSMEYLTVRAVLLGKHSGLDSVDLRRMVSWLQNA